MKVLQLIDSLRPGGAEKMAVNIANALLPHVKESLLCCTREEGILKNELQGDVKYIYLDKKSSLDLIALYKLRNFILKNNVDVVHAHSTSFFMAGLLKLSGGKFKLLWHDHYGESENMESRDFKFLKFFSSYFTGIISVNTQLKNWALKHLNCKNVREIKNFIYETHPSGIPHMKLKGSNDDFKIICVANLRPQKDHLTLLRAFEMLESYPNVSLHLIGEDPNTEYSASIMKALRNSPVKGKIFYYGAQSSIIPLLRQANLGVLASRSEGLPIALLEYGIAGLPVVCTAVGQCKEVVGPKLNLVKKESPEELAKAIKTYVDDPLLSNINSTLLYNRVQRIYNKSVINNFLELYKY
jgi:glycosyltransferase involved in cell wall biosynthesis